MRHPGVPRRRVPLGLGFRVNPPGWPGLSVQPCRKQISRWSAVRMRQRALPHLQAHAQRALPAPLVNNEEAPCSLGRQAHAFVSKALLLLKLIACARVFGRLRLEEHTCFEEAVWSVGRQACALRDEGLTEADSGQRRKGSHA